MLPGYWVMHFPYDTGLYFQADRERETSVINMKRGHLLCDGFHAPPPMDVDWLASLRPYVHI